jgi:hypothetical protein
MAQGYWRSALDKLDPLCLLALFDPPLDSGGSQAILPVPSVTKELRLRAQPHGQGPWLRMGKERSAT